MFDFVDEGMFLDAVADHFSVLAQDYAEEQGKEPLASLEAYSDDLFETSFVILDRETGKPMNMNAVLTKRDAAEEFLKVVGADKFEIGILLREQ
ncbi:MAG TPA: hypothetical protein VFI31_28875 [Pirellulales bacterium]|nr:hypothetical protein [Pirellulales bacterium]